MISPAGIARIAHEAQRAYGYVTNDRDTVAWDYLTPDEQKKVLADVERVALNPAYVVPEQPSPQAYLRDCLLMAIVRVFIPKEPAVPKEAA
jgi:hypothetical protein